MTMLKISRTGEEYTQEQKSLFWDIIHWLRACPECGAKNSMLEGPHGGLAVNIMCSECKTVFWTAPHRGFGAYPIGTRSEDVMGAINSPEQDHYEDPLVNPDAPRFGKS